MKPRNRVIFYINRGVHLRIEELAALIYTSPRNLTRLFKATTGITSELA